MATWIDIFSLVATLALVGGIIYGIVYISRQITDSVKSTKESLRDRGLTISDKGVSVKTSARFGREDYVDATQRGIIKAYNAASFGKADSKTPTTTYTHTDTKVKSTIPGATKMDRENSSSSGSGEEKKKRGSLFRRKES